MYEYPIWYKLLKQGLNGKIFHIIRSIYSDVKSCEKNYGSISEFFDSNVGLLQGEVISPLLFSLFINDIEPGGVAQSVGHLTRKSEILGSIPGLATYFRFSFR